MKKLLSVFLFGALMLPLMAQAGTMRDTVMAEASKSTMSFDDMQKGYPNFIAVAYLFGRQVVQGYADDTFKPDNAVNRAELVKMVVGMMDGDPNAIANRDCFNDVKREWFAPYICFAKSEGWVEGYTGKMFKPADPVNRAEAMKIILNVMIKKSYWPTLTSSENSRKMPSDADMSQWYGTYLRFAWVKDLLDKQHVVNNSYKPGNSMTRKEVAEMIFRTWLYMAERLETATLIADEACFVADHSTMTEEQIADLWATSYLDLKGYTQADVDGLESKYASDEIVQDFADDLMKDHCKGGVSVDMAPWEAFENFGTM
jgi:hypothetical protein